MSDRRMAAALFAIAFLARAVFRLGAQLFGSDGGRLLEMADHFAGGRAQEALSVGYHPLYPLLIAGGRSFLGGPENAGFWISVTLGAFAVVPLFLAARPVFGQGVAALGGLLYAVHPHTVDLHADVMMEATFAFFLFSTIWLCRRVMEEPSPARSLLAGIAAGAAYLTRPEGILAAVLVLFWPLAALVRRRERVGLRIAGLVLCAAALLATALPYLLWIRVQKGHWSLSMKGSVQVATGGPQEEVEPPSGPDDPTVGKRGYAAALRAAGQLTYYVLAPFLVLGLFALPRLAGRGLLFYFSFPLGYLAGVLHTVRVLPYFSHRYLVPVLDLLLVLAALGIAVALRPLARRMEGPRLAAAASALVLAVAAVLSARGLKVQRLEQAALRDAAAWIRAQGLRAPRIYCTIEKLPWLAGGVLLYYDKTWPRFEQAAARGDAEFYVYMEKDLARGRPAYLERVRSSPHLGPAEVFPRATRAGVMNVYVHRARPPED